MSKLLAAAALAAAATSLPGLPVSRGLVGVRADGSADMAEIRRLIGEINSAHADFRTQNDARIAQIEARGAADPVTAEQVATINARIGELQAALDAANQTVAGLRIGGTGGAGETPEARQQREAFAAFMGGRFGPKGENAPQARGTVGSDPDGGYLAPAQVESGITRILGATVAMRRLAQVMPISSASYVKHKSLGGTSSGWVGETDTGDDRGETNTPRLSRMEFVPGELYAEPGASQQFLDDAGADVEGWYNGEVAQEFSEKEGAAFVSGDGAKKPKGFLSYGTVANANYAWGKLGFVKTGQAAAFSASPYDELISLIHALKAGYRNGAQFLMNDLTLAAYRQVKDDNGNYIWQPSAQAGQPSTLLGYGVETDDNMPDVAAGAFPVAFANWKQFYLIVDRMGVRVLRNPYKVNGIVLFYSTKRVGGGVQNFEAGKLLKVSA